MRILIFSTQMLPVGGIETHLKTLMKSLSCRGFQITLVCSAASMPQEQIRELDAAGVEHIFYPITIDSGSRLARAAWLIYTIFCLRRRHFDVVYTNGQGNLPAIIWLLFREKVPVIHHHHSSADADEQATWTRLYRQLLKSSDKLVACSESTAHNLAHALGRKRGNVVPIMIPPTDNSARRPLVAKRVPSDQLTLGYLGRLVSTKGLDVIMRLSREPSLNDVHWVIYGAGADYDAQSFEPYSTITYKGTFEGPEQLSIILSSLDGIVLFSTHSEGLPVSLLEASSQGIPWIASDRGGVRDIALDPIATQVLPRDFAYSDALSAVIALKEAVFNERIDYLSYSEGFRSRFSYEASLAAWIDLFCETGGSHSS